MNLFKKGGWKAKGKARNQNIQEICEFLLNKIRFNKTKTIPRRLQVVAPLEQHKCNRKRRGKLNCVTTYITQNKRDAIVGGKEEKGKGETSGNKGETISHAADLFLVG